MRLSRSHAKPSCGKKLLDAEGKRRTIKRHFRFRRTVFPEVVPLRVVGKATEEAATMGDCSVMLPPLPRFQ